MSSAAHSDEFDQQLAKSNDADRYQAAMGFVYDYCGPQVAAQIVKTAVLRARKPGTNLPNQGVGVPDDWHITRGQHGLALAMKLAPDRFPGPIFTTNFDPLITLALLKEGFHVNPLGIPLDGVISASVKLTTDVIDVFHLHGYWEGATLHRPQQLLADRPQLQQSLQRHLQNTHLVIMAYGGWDDIFTTAIANCLSDPCFSGEVSWCFYSDDALRIRAENAALFARFAPGIAQGRISFFRGIDCHSIFDDLIGTLGLTPAARAAVEASPMPGWQLVTSESLDSEPALTGAESVRFFDGAMPTLRHAISPLIPRLTHAQTMIERLASSVDSECRMQLIRAAGGEGKSTALLQAAAMAAQHYGWAVLYRPGTDAMLNADVVAGLDPARRWLIVADDAEGLIDDLWRTVDRLHQVGRSNIFLLLAARDTDWLVKEGDRKAWSTRIEKLDDVVIGDIAADDALRVVETWAVQGDAGLRALKHLPTDKDRAVALIDAARTRDERQDEGSFFGGLLKTRFGANGLIDHLLPLLEPLKDQPVAGGTVSLFDALLYIANCHASGMKGLDNRVLAKLCGVTVHRVWSAIVAPLGRELGAAQSRSLVLTRHKSVADAIVVAADRLNANLCQSWRDIVLATAAVSKPIAVADRVEQFSEVMHAGSRLHRDLPQSLHSKLRGEIAIVAAEAAVEAMPEWSSAIAALARAYRSAGDPQKGAALLQRYFRGLTYDTNDWRKNYRGYVCEWATCQSQIGGRQSRLANAWLDSVSLSDRLPVPISWGQVRLSCTGLAHAYDHLLEDDPNGVFAKGHRAALALGSLANPDQHLAGILKTHGQKLDQRNVPPPANADEVYTWLRDAAFAAWRELDDKALRNLKLEGRLAFQTVRQLLSKQ